MGRPLPITVCEDVRSPGNLHQKTRTGVSVEGDLVDQVDRMPSCMVTGFLPLLMNRAALLERVKVRHGVRDTQSFYPYPPRPVIDSHCWMPRMTTVETKMAALPRGSDFWTTSIMETGGTLFFLEDTLSLI